MPRAELIIRLQSNFLGEAAARAGFVMLAALLLSFLLIRASTRLMRSPRVPWWPGSVTLGEGALHVHHLVFGIVLLLVSGFLGITFTPASPWDDLVAATFGVGAGLTLDEFALWLHLEDVYWAEEGRRSLDAMLVATVLGGLVIAGATPFGSGGTTGSALAIIGTVAIVVALALVAALKGKYVLALAGLLVPFLGLIAALRLAKPASPWARRRYREGSGKRRRAEARHARQSRRYRRWQDVVGGRPDAPAA